MIVIYAFLWWYGLGLVSCATGFISCVMGCLTDTGEFDGRDLKHTIVFSVLGPFMTCFMIWFLFDKYVLDPILENIDDDSIFISLKRK